jgi:hypothetical protein
MVDKVKDIITRSRILLQGQDIITRSGYYYKVRILLSWVVVHQCLVSIKQER